MLRWALEGVRTLSFFHEPGATPQPQDRAHKRMLGRCRGHERQAPRALGPPPTQEGKEAHRGKRRQRKDPVPLLLRSR
eukprot:3271717-Prymnesium_polylepis.1